MTRKVIYRLPPYVARIANPHYIADTGSNSPPNYAPYKLVSLGNYPLGVYQVNADGLLGGTFQAIDSTNTSITLLHPGPTGDYPAKSDNTVMDINTYQFAYQPYLSTDALTYRNFNEKAYDPYVYDYDAYPGQDSVQFERISVTKNVYYTRGQINTGTNSFNYRLGNPMLHNGIMMVYGSTSIYLPDLPGIRNPNFTDPTGLGIVDASTISRIQGRYLIVITDRQGFGGEFSYQIYPQPPASCNFEITIDPIGLQPPDIVENQIWSSGVAVTVTYDSLYRTSTGPGNSIILPYNNTMPSDTQPVTIVVPEEVQNMAYRFYVPGTGPVEFDLYRGLDIAPSGELLSSDLIPANLIEMLIR